MNNQASTAQIEANRENSLKSTGPRTRKGKATACRNSLKHGLLSKEVVITTGEGRESRAEFTKLLRALNDDFQPQGTLEAILVDKIAVCVWRLRRVLRCEVGQIRLQTDSLALNLTTDRFDEAREATRERPGEQRFYHLIRNTIGIDELLECLEDFHQEVEEEGRLSGESITRLHTMFGTGEGTHGYTIAVANCLVTMPEDKRTPDIPPPEKCKASLKKAIRDEAKSLLDIREVIAGREDLQDSAQLAGFSLPQSASADNIVRYETTIERQLYRAIGKLERIQARRRGDQLPVRVNVTLSGDA